MLLNSVSVLDSIPSVNVDVAVQTMVQSASWFKDYIVPFLGIAGVLLAFFIVRLADVNKKYNYYVSLQKFIDIYFTEFVIQMKLTRELYVKNITYLNDVLEKKSKTEFKFNPIIKEYDLERIFDLNQVDSYYTFVYIKKCKTPEDIYKLQKAYNDTLINLKLLYKSFEHVEDYFQNHKKLVQINDDIRNLSQEISREIFLIRTNSKIEPSIMALLNKEIENYASKLANPDMPTHIIHQMFCENFSMLCLNNYKDLVNYPTFMNMMMFQTKLVQSVNDFYYSVQEIKNVLTHMLSTADNVMKEFNIDYNIIKTYKNKSKLWMIFNL